MPGTTQLQTILTPFESAPVAPSPPEEGLMGHLRALRKDELGFMTRAARDYGDVVRLRLGPITAHLFARPEHVRHVLLDHQDNYSKQSRGYTKLRQILGNGLLTSEGEFWRRQRRIAQPAFHHRRLAGFGETMVRRTRALATEWDALKDGAVVDLSEAMMRLALQIVGDTMLSVDLTGEAAAVGESLTIALHEINRRINDPFAFVDEWLPTPRNVQFVRACRTIDRIVRRIIEERREMATEARPEDLLTMLMEARDEETGEGMTDDQLRDEVLTIFLAGHETTANALTWTFYLLSKDPTVRRRLQMEVDSVLEGRPPSAADLHRLDYTKRVLQESMRLYPPAWILGRQCEGDDVVGGFAVPAGSLVFVSPYITHHHPEVWDNPEGFDPDRFAPGEAPDPKSFAWFPFGGGPRICIGKGFAMMEAQLLLATLTQHHVLDLVQGHPVEMEPLITLRPKYGMKMTVHPRNDRCSAYGPPDGV